MFLVSSIHTQVALNNLMFLQYSGFSAKFFNSLYEVLSLRQQRSLIIPRIKAALEQDRTIQPDIWLSGKAGQKHIDRYFIGGTRESSRPAIIY